MSRLIPIALQEHLDQSSRTLATCVHVTRRDGVEIFATDLNRAIVYDGDTYLPLGFVRKDLTTEDSGGIGTTDIEGILSSEAITEDDLQAGVWDGARWVMFRVNYMAPEDGRIHLGEGELGSCRTGRLRWTAELLGLIQSAHNSLGNLNSPMCIHNFGRSEGGFGRGAGCTFDLSTVTETGTVEEMDSDYYGMHDSARTEPDGTFSGGIFRIMSGPFSGREIDIRIYTQGYWVLFVAAPMDMTGVDYEIVRGCDKSLATCRDTYNNILDRLASDYTQGNDIAFQPGRHE